MTRACGAPVNPRLFRKGYLDSTSLMVNEMFIRFVCGAIDESSRRAAGLFCAVTLLEENHYLVQVDRV
jgi:hypothetical protein